MQVGLHSIRVEPALPAARASGVATVLDSEIQMPQHASKIGAAHGPAAPGVGTPDEPCGDTACGFPLW